MKQIKELILRKEKEEVLRLWNNADEQGIKEEKNKLDYINLILGENSKKTADDKDDSPYEQYNNTVPSVVNPPRNSKKGREMNKVKRTAYPYWMTVGKMGR